LFIKTFIFLHPIASCGLADEMFFIVYVIVIIAFPNRFYTYPFVKLIVALT